MTMGSLSPRTVAPNQTLALRISVTAPTTTALGAIQYAAHPEGILETTRAKRNRRRAERDEPADLVLEANA